MEMAAIGEKWEVEYSRFFHFPSSLSLSLSTITESNRARLRGTWLSSSPSSLSAAVKLSADFSISDFILSVSFLGKFLEEHYISKLNFTWPHVSCMSGFPARGSRAVMISYKDQSGQIQKFALRFSAVRDTEAFMATLKELMEFPKDFGNKSHEKLVSEISSQSDFVPSEEIAYRPVEDYYTAINAYKSIEQLESSFNGEVAHRSNLPQSNVLNHDGEVAHQSNLPVEDYYTAINTYESIDQLESRFNAEVAHQSNLPRSNVLSYDVGNILGGLPPSFTSLLTMSTQANMAEVKPTLSEQADIKLQIMRYLDNSSFQDLMGKVDEVMNEIGNGMLM